MTSSTSSTSSYRTPLATVLVVVLALLLSAAAPSAQAATVAPDLESQLVDLINAERADAGRPRLRLELQLTRIARNWSTTMDAEDDLFHRPDLREQIDGDWRRIGENVGVGSDLRRIHDAFMASPGHRDNVLGDFDRVGVGIVEDDGRIWITVNFLRGNGDFPVFRDVSRGAHRTSIEAVFARATTAGCDRVRYCPANSVTRAQMATFLARELDLAPRTPDFRDVSRSHPHAGAIGALEAAGITTGCEDGRYCPDQSVGRAQMASFLARAMRLDDRAPSGLRDVPASHTHAGAIGALQAAGITQGCSDTRFCPTERVSRAQMASFLTRAWG